MHLSFIRIVFNCVFLINFVQINVVNADDWSYYSIYQSNNLTDSYTKCNSLGGKYLASFHNENELTGLKNALKD